MTEGPNQPLLTVHFFWVALVAGSFFFAMGMTMPVLPRFVKDELGRGDIMVGAVVAATAFGAILARPVVGYVGDKYGRNILMLGGALLSAIMLVLHIFGDNEPFLFLVRIAFGLGQGALMVGATTIAVDLAPENRRGEATSYIFVALHVGSGSGPIFGEWLLRQWSFNTVWVAAACVTLVSAAAAVFVPAMPDHDDAPPARMQLLHPAGVRPGIVLGLGILGFTGFNAFAPLFADEIGVDNIGPVFLASSFTIVLMRSFGAKWPDKLGPVRGGTIALIGATIGLLVIGLWQEAPGLYLGTIIMSAGISQLLPSLVSAAVSGVPVTQRSAAMGTYTLFLDLSIVIGAIVFGFIANASSYGTGFLTAAAVTMGALAVLWATIARDPT